MVMCGLFIRMEGGGRGRKALQAMAETAWSHGYIYNFVCPIKLEGKERGECS